MKERVIEAFVQDHAALKALLKPFNRNSLDCPLACIGILVARGFFSNQVSNVPRKIASIVSAILVDEVFKLLPVGTIILSISSE